MSLNQAMQEALTSLVERIDMYESKRATNIENFKSQVGELINEYYSGTFVEQLKQIGEMKEENARRFEELTPQMEAIYQIRDIYRQSLNRQR